MSKEEEVAAPIPGKFFRDWVADSKAKESFTGPSQPTMIFRRYGCLEEQGKQIMLGMDEQIRNQQEQQSVFPPGTAELELELHQRNSKRIEKLEAEFAETTVGFGPYVQLDKNQQTYTVSALFGGGPTGEIVHARPVDFSAASGDRLVVGVVKQSEQQE